MIYLDYAATTPLDSEVLEVMLPYLKENFGNADSLHAMGRAAAYAVSEARDKIAALLGVSAGEVYFTSGGTEADNWAVRCMGEGSVLASAIEHRAVLDSCALRLGSALVSPTHGGLITPQSVREGLKEDTSLACVMAVNNETGCIQDLAGISAVCKERGVLLFSDCVQAACCLDLKEVAKLVDGLSLSAHKTYGPKGVGALVVKKGVKLCSLIAGGEQERGLRGGTLNVAGIVGFACALERVQQKRETFVAHTTALRDAFEERLKSALGDRVRIDGENRAGNISHLTLVGGGQVLLNKLDLKGVCASGGAACSAHSAFPSHVLTAMGRSDDEAKRGVRFSFGKDTTREEALRAADILIYCLQGS